MKHPGKFGTHWLGPFEVAYVTKGGFVQLKTLNGESKEGLVNCIMTTSYLTALNENKGRSVYVPGAIETGYQTQKRQSA
jgi:hypothetical protein